MPTTPRTSYATAGSLALALGALLAPPAEAQFHIGPEEFVQAFGVEIQVGGYSVPSWADWNSDGLMDLIVGEGSGSDRAFVRYYLNTGIPGAPTFGSFDRARSQGSVLTQPGGG